MDEDVCEQLRLSLERRLPELPLNFHDSFLFTRTGRNFCHPITTGILAEVVKSLPDVTFVGLDVRFNEGDRIKFQPDIVGFKADAETPIICVDFESPNSSDARVIVKDVDPYRLWADKQPYPPPYVIVTSLPDSPSSDWELRWTAEDQYNFGHRGKRNDLIKNPFMYWMTFFEPELAKRNLSNIAILNIDGKQVRRVQ